MPSVGSSVVGEELVEGADRNMRRPVEHLAAGVALKAGAITPRAAAVLQRAAVALRAAADDISLACVLTEAGRANLAAWLNQVAPSTVIDTWCAIAAERALLRPGEEVQIAISGLSTRSGAEERLCVPPEAFAWTLQPSKAAGHGLDAQDKENPGP